MKAGKILAPKVDGSLDSHTPRVDAVTARFGLPGDRPYDNIVKLARVLEREVRDLRDRVSQHHCYNAQGGSDCSVCGGTMGDARVGRSTVAATLAQAQENVRPIVEAERAAEHPTAETMSLHIGGVGRVAASTDPPDAFEHRWLQVYFDRRPTDDELRAFHDYVREFRGVTSEVLLPPGENP